MAVFTLTRFTVARKAWHAAAAHLEGPGRAAVRQAGGALQALWSPQIGVPTNAGFVLSAWADEASAVAGAGSCCAGQPWCTASEQQVLEPTARPGDDQPPQGDGIWVLRWFVIDSDGLEEFVRLSVDAWQSFERAHPVHIHGLYRQVEPAQAPGVTTLLLLTHYGSHAVWEQTREVARDPRAWDNFVRRQAFTHWSEACSVERVALP